MKIIPIIAFSALFGACADPLELGSTESHVESANRLAVNRLAVNRLAVNRLAVNRLAVNGLGKASLDAEALAAEDGGLELLTYIVSCALPEGGSLDVSGAKLNGSIGLAPQWLDEGLDVTARRWVSACLLARVNYFGVQVHLSIRGAHDALATTTEEASAYSLYEGAFFGDLFGGEIAEKMSCTSALKATAPQIGTMPLRECTVTDPTTRRTRCDYTPTGVCEDVCSDATCAGQTEVIHVFLETP